MEATRPVAAFAQSRELDLAMEQTKKLYDQGKLLASPPHRYGSSEVSREEVPPRTPENHLYQLNQGSTTAFFV